MKASKMIGMAVGTVIGIGAIGQGFATAEQQNPAPPAVYEEIKINRKDVTGDGRPDLITLMGKRHSSDSPYYEQLKLMVQDSAAKKLSFFTTPYGGYQPELFFCDFTGEKANQILIQAPTGGSAGTSDYYLFSDKNNQPTLMPVPQPLTILGTFQDGYKVPLTIKETNQTTILDVSDRRSIYEENGVYKNGKLLRPTEVMPNTYSVLQPIDENRDGICELKGVQRVSGVANADTIAYVESMWKWDKNRWILQNARVKKAEMD